jgi:DNA modification methylase
MMSLSKRFQGAHGVYCLGDARELIREVPDQSIDAIITDPPWGVYGYDPFDDPKVFFDIQDEFYRVLKDDSWLVFFYTPKRLPEVISSIRRFSYVWVMPYIFFSFGTLSRNPLGSQASYSIILIYSKGKPKIKVARRDTIFSYELPILADTTVKEPQFKPTGTVAELLTVFTREGDAVLDPFAGYGSIPLVCELFGRRWLAFEIDPLKYEVAKRIIENRRIYDIRRLKGELAPAKPESSPAPLKSFFKEPDQTPHL